MKKAVLYARVSSEIQQKERTIDSQIEALKRQIIEAGDVLVKEYIDDGYSGSQIQRPALDEFRKDLKTNLFDSVYFLNTDRIARDVAHQTIIISEILKAKKQIIINGKDYVHNPENKFALTVLGAVAELERAKILERSHRGRQHRLREGHILGFGHNTYGYNYIPRNRDKDADARMEIREDEAKIVRYIFERYEAGDGYGKIVRNLEENETLTKEGKKLWRVERIKELLCRNTYMGIKYFNTKRYVKDTGKLKWGKKVIRDRSDWVGVKVPAIVSKELFEKVQKRIEETKNKYRNPKIKQLLCGIVKCGECGQGYHSYRRFYKTYAGGKVSKIYHKVAYYCNRQMSMHIHKKGLIEPCHNPEIISWKLEDCAWRTINENLFEPSKLKKHMEFFKDDKKLISDHENFQKSLKRIDEKISDLLDKKRTLVDRYATGTMERDDYGKKNLECDDSINRLRLERMELIKSVPLLHDKEAVEESVEIFCKEVKEQFRRCINFETKRAFLLRFIEKVIFLKGEVTICGSIPVIGSSNNDADKLTETEKIEFRIKTHA